MKATAQFSPTDPIVVKRNAGIALVTTTVINLLIYALANAKGWIPDELPSGAEQFSILSVIIASVVPMLIGGILLSVLVRITTHPVLLFCLIAAVVFIGSLFVPLTTAGASNAFKTTLVSMHLLTAVIGTAILVTGVEDEPEDAEGAL